MSARVPWPITQALRYGSLLIYRFKLLPVFTVEMRRRVAGDRLAMAEPDGLK